MHDCIEPRHKSSTLRSTECCLSFLCVFSVPLFYHVSATVQRLLLSFIYVHREEIPLSAVTNFVDALSAAVSILPTSEWIKLLLDLLKNFCLDKNCGSGSVHVAMRKESECGDTYHQYSTMSEYVSSELATDNTSSVFVSLKNDVPSLHDGSSLLGPHSNFPGSEGLHMEVEKVREFPDMETETNKEFPDVSSMATTQLPRTDEVVQTETGMHIVYSVEEIPLFLQCFGWPSERTSGLCNVLESCTGTYIYTHPRLSPEL